MLPSEMRLTPPVHRLVDAGGTAMLGEFDGRYGDARCHKFAFVF